MMFLVSFLLIPFTPPRRFYFDINPSYKDSPFHLALDQPQASYQHAIMTHVAVTTAATTRLKTKY